MDNNSNNNFSNPMDEALAAVDAATSTTQSSPSPVATPGQVNSFAASPVAAAPIQPATQPVTSHNYGTTDFSQVNNSAPLPATTSVEQMTAITSQAYSPQPVVAPAPVPVTAPQPAAQPAPNTYPANQQIVPQQPSPAPVPAPAPVAMHENPINNFANNLPQSDAVFQPTPQPTPAAQSAAPQPPTAMNMPPGYQPGPIPTPGMPMSMGGVPQPGAVGQNAPIANPRNSMLTAYWPALVGGGVILIALVIFLIIFL